MAGYEYTKLLSYLDFEELSRDVVSLQTGIDFESFAEGKDHGIDFRFSKMKNDNDIIIQVKRYSNYSDLKFTLKKELTKINKLNPSRYILCTSLELSVDQKNEIFGLLQPFVKRIGDIYTKSKFDEVLSLNDDLLTKHYKLWLTDIKVLKKVFHTDIYTDIKFELLHMEKAIKTYVYNKSYDNGVETLRKYRFLLISGNPGIGKSTLARVIAFNILNRHKEHKYEFIFVRTLDDLKRMYNESTPQIIVLDDFLGRTISEFDSSGNRPSDLLNFVHQIRQSKTHFMILTTREYILQQAKREYDLLSNPILELAKTTIQISNYTNKIRSHILFNHLYYSGIQKEYIASVLNDNLFLKIIKTKNFNPRIIEHITNKDFLIKDSVSPTSYPIYIKDKISNATDVWEDIFKNNKITQEAKILCYVLFLSRHRNYVLSWYEKNYNLTLKCFEHQYSINISENQFDLSLQEVLNTIIVLENDKLDFYDPSVEDFLTYYINQNKTLKHDLFDCCNLLKPDYKIDVLNLLTFSKTDKNKLFIDTEYFTKLKEYFIDNINDISIQGFYYFINKLPVQLCNELQSNIVGKLQMYSEKDLRKLHTFEFMYYLKLIEKFNVIGLSKEQMLSICMEYSQSINYLDNIDFLINKYGKETCTLIYPSMNTMILDAVDIIYSELDDIGECQMLISSCSNLQDQLDIDLEEYISDAQELEYKFEEREYNDADEIYDVYRENKYDELMSDQTIINLYDTLSID